MGIDSDFGRAYAKAQIEAGNSLPTAGAVLVSVRDEDKGVVGIAVRELARNGFSVLATPGTAAYLRELGIAAESVVKVGQGPNDVVARIDKGEVNLVINTVETQPQAARDSLAIRRSALQRGLPYFTTAAGARAAASAIRARVK
jgi:carbamoyl-phosphate synthase large subunit